MKINELIQKTKELTWQEKLIFIAKNFDKIAFSTSFSIEDQIILDFIVKNNLRIEIFTIDTGRLPKETYNVWQVSLEKYKIKILPFYPQNQRLENFVLDYGINAFYESIELRKKCCFIRKVEPLQRALANKNIWISGVRKEHSIDRNNKEFFEFDEPLNLIKFYPLLEVLESQIWQLINQNSVPFNQLYKEGYKSIGCEPCSRKIKEGEEIRDGRWWWERGNKECGLHNHTNTKSHL